MRAPLICSAGDVGIENVLTPRIIEPTDAVVHVTRASLGGMKYR